VFGIVSRPSAASAYVPAFPAHPAKELQTIDAPTRLKMDAVAYEEHHRQIL